MESAQPLAWSRSRSEAKAEVATPDTPAGWELARELLDYAAQAGIAVVWGSGLKYGPLAANLSDPALNATLHQYVAELGGHPALAGWYGCDDCCNKGKNRGRAPGDTQLAGFAEVRRTLRRVDPYHLVFGTVACGDLWLWTEEGSGQGLDVRARARARARARQRVRERALTPSRKLPIGLKRAPGSILPRLWCFPMQVVMQENYWGGYDDRAPKRAHPMTFEPLGVWLGTFAFGSADQERAKAYAVLAQGGFAHVLWYPGGERERLTWRVLRAPRCCERASERARFACRRWCATGGYDGHIGALGLRARL